MGKIHKISSVKLISGFIFKEEEFFELARGLLEREFGKIDFESQSLVFIHTSYYENELGKDLKRKFVSFKKLIPPQKLCSIKLFTNNIEAKLSKQGLRRVNIDPGYLDLAKLILASTKDFTHRIYLAKGIFAEVALYFQGKSFKAWEWTYPDYRTNEYAGIFNRIREIYNGQIKGQ